jgi:hypothetical protein
MNHKIVDVHQAAVLIRAGVFADGQRIGTDPNGWALYARHGFVLADMRSRQNAGDA